MGGISPYRGGVSILNSIKFKGGFVQSINPETRRLSVKVDNIQSGVARVRGSLDVRILNRRSIGAGLSRAGSSLGKIEQKLQELNSFVNRSVDQYTSAENKVNRKAVSLIASWNKDFRLVECNSPAIREKSKNAKKVEKKSSSIQDVLKYFDAANQQMGLLDAALVSSQVASIATAFTLGRKLSINYIGGKPSLWQKLKGGYKFSVGADPSWTSKGKYSSKVARYLYDFSKTTPTNPIAKQLHKVVASYNNPSAILKHVAGFPKNANFMKATTLFDSINDRITMGAKEVAGNIAEAKGFTKMGKGIPLVGSAISVVSAVSEFASSISSNKSLGESIGRTFGSVVLDFGAIGVGAKAGAMIGSLGGPVGAVIGGAVGGLVGGFVSVKYGDDVKDFAGKAGKSIGSWFK
jgi:hypothetical protein